MSDNVIEIGSTAKVLQITSPSEVSDAINEDERAVLQAISTIFNEILPKRRDNVQLGISLEMRRELKQAVRSYYRAQRKMVARHLTFYSLAQKGVR